jgi:RimJ/RimL family protein N-acetyltransferase
MEIEPFELSGRFVRLTPIAAVDVDGLLAAATEDRATYGYTTVPADQAGMVAYVDDLLAQRDRGEAVPFATTDARDGRVVGATRFLHLRHPFDRAAPDMVEIGGTWLAASAQRGPVNTEAKLLMLTHAFERWHVRKVELLTDARNTRSRAAIERVGGRLDGVLRAAVPSLVAGEEGSTRDNAVYSILPSEWPDVRAALEARLAR